MESPSSISSWMGDDHLPLLTIPGTIVPVNLDNVRLHNKCVVETSNLQHAFSFDNMNIDLGGIHILDIQCCGTLCDAIGMYTNGKLATKCSCYALSKRDADITGVFDLRLTTSDGKVMIVRNHTSKKFTRFFMKNQKLVIGLNAASFYDRRVMNELRQKMEAMLTFINSGDFADIVTPQMRMKGKGFSVQGWVRRGTIIDLAADQPVGAGQKNESRRMVPSSDLSYHITSIVPTCRDPGLLPLLDGMRYNAGALLDVINEHENNNVADDGTGSE